ncbi:hypothetical protein LZ30DRAFT_799773 [Colletotrichum cereale]|nr:hypothetical protein LZ30DRAFT_799773 [Colletotrichum cereale]
MAGGKLLDTHGRLIARNRLREPHQNDIMDRPKKLHILVIRVHRYTNRGRTTLFQKPMVPGFLLAEVPFSTAANSLFQHMVSVSLEPRDVATNHGGLQPRQMLSNKEAKLFFKETKECEAHFPALKMRGRPKHRLDKTTATLLSNSCSTCITKVIIRMQVSK